MKIFRRLLKIILIFMFVTGFMFSSMPFDFLSSALRQFATDRNVVDKMWLAQKDGNVVDNFTPLQRMVDKLQVRNAYAAVGDARIEYGQSTNAAPWTSFYTASTNSWNVKATTGISGTANVGWTVSKESPTEDVTVLATQSSTGKLDIFCRTGSTWTKDISNVTVGTSAATRRFDVEFEKTSGIPMVLYSTNAATTNELSYYRKTGAGCGTGSWTGPTVLNPTRVTGIVLWVELEARQTAGSNVLAAAFSDANATAGGKLEAMIWNAGAWANESPAGAAQGWSELSLELSGTAGAQNNRSFDLAFETNSGDLFIAWGTSTGANGTNGWRYATCSATLPCTWSGALTPSGPLDDATVVACAPDPGSDAIACLAEGNSGSDLSAWTWTGTAVGATTAANADATLLAVSAGDRTIGIDWVVSGTQRMAVGVYAETTTGVKYIYYDTVGAAWRTNTTTSFTPTGAPATAMQSVQVSRNPNNPAQLLVVLTDSASDLFSLRLNYNGAAGGATTALSTWNASTGSPIEATPGVSSITSQPFWFDWIKAAPSATLTISATAGSQVVNLNSGSTSQYINSTSCNSAATCSAFTLSISSGSETITSIKVTETGTADATNNLANLALFYDTDGNYSNGVTGQYGTTVAGFTTEAANVTGSLAISAGTTYYFYVRFDLVKGATYPVGGQIIDFQIAATGDVGTSGTPTKTGAPATLAGATTVLPNVTGVTYQGGGMTNGGQSGYSATISGYGFDSAGIGSRANCAGASGTGCVRFVVGGNATISDGDITAWTNTSIVFSVSPTIATYGGASALQVVISSQSAPTSLTFYIYPSITTTPGGDAGRENDSVIFGGNHFGSAQGTAVFTGGFGNVSAAVTAWSDTSITAMVPTGITDTVYTGDITITRNSDSKTDTAYGGNIFRILPRITSNAPVSGVVGDVISINGDHLCQSGTCPATPPTAGDIVQFGSTAAVAGDFATLCSGGSKWSNTQVCVKVPTGTPLGSQPTKITSNSIYVSNTQAFSINSTAPNNPANLNQYNGSGIVIVAGGSASSTNIILKADISASLVIGMALQVETQPVGTGFSCGAGNCVSAVEGTVGGGGACASCTSLNAAQITLSSLTEGQYHWQARVRNTTTNEYSGWVAFGSGTDFIKDTTAPTITSGPSTSNLGSNSVSITWGTNELSSTQIQYNKTGIFGNCSGDCTVITNIPPAGVTNHGPISISNLNSGTLYYYRVRSKDAAGNELVSSNFNFTTNSVTQPGKTTVFHIMGNPNFVAGGATASSTFSIIAPETSPSIQNAFVEISGISAGGGTNNFQVWVNSQPAQTYVINASSITGFKIFYQVSGANLNLNNNNVIYINPGMNTYITSAKIIVTYSYTP